MFQKRKYFHFLETTIHAKSSQILIKGMFFVRLFLSQVHQRSAFKYCARYFYHSMEGARMKKFLWDCLPATAFRNPLQWRFVTQEGGQNGNFDDVMFWEYLSLFIETCSTESSKSSAFPPRANTSPSTPARRTWAPIVAFRRWSAFGLVFPLKILVQCRRERQ